MLETNAIFKTKVSAADISGGLPRWFVGLAVLIVAVSSLGCEQISGVSRVQVVGEVTLDRKPLADVMVAFVPIRLRNDSGKISKVAFGKSDNAGRFKLRTSDYKGVAPGEYRVLFYNGEENPEDLDLDKPGREDFMRGLLESPKDLDIRNPTHLPDVTSEQDERLRVILKGGSGIPSQYNFRSELRFKAKAGAGILYPKFKLQSHPRD